MIITSLNLSDLNGRDGFVINGTDEFDYSGEEVSEAGDINGDGIDDLIIGAPRVDAIGNSSGASYVVFGGTTLGSGGSFDLSELDGSNGFVINGVDAFDSSGSPVSSAGDINSDGIADLIIGALLSSMNFISPKTDFAFKKIFGSTDSKDILISFLNAILDNEQPVIEDLEIIAPYSLFKVRGLKDTYLDVKVKITGIKL